MWNLYRYRLKRLVINKSLIFWAGIFPIILGTFFGLCFSSISEKTENMDAMKIAILDDGKNQDSQSVMQFFDSMEKEGYVKIVTKDKKEADKALKKNKIIGIVNISDEINIEIAENGMYQTILKSVIDSYIQGAEVINDTIKNNPSKVNDVIKQLYDDTAYNSEKSIADGNMDPFVQYYFALFAMTCMFGATFGMTNTKEIQANQAVVAVRRNISPTKKMQAVLTDFLASLTIQTTIFIVVFLYIKFVMGIDFGDKYLLILIAGFVASMFGISYGYFIGVIVKANENTKNGIISGTVLFMCFLSGLMVGDMKSVIEDACPIVNRINPAALISDSFYSVCVTGGMEMYIRALVTLLIYIVVFSIVSVVVLRREKYADI